MSIEAFVVAHYGPGIAQVLCSMYKWRLILSEIPCLSQWTYIYDFMIFFNLILCYDFAWLIFVHDIWSDCCSSLLNVTISCSAFISQHFTHANILFWRHLPSQFAVYPEAAPAVHWVLQSGQVLQQSMKFTCLTMDKGLIVMAKQMLAHCLRIKVQWHVCIHPSFSR